ncbi:MAG: hypothetical protein A6F70_09060 [Cycloclasticus sp. symbiont of Bathymodiolus heckerae]|nr:MAG: hypothetical protein A6F70_09060 [Cycloclasticus sp. symbiont of Bathymodiolus heckerae]
MKALRVTILLCVLVAVAFYTKLQRLESTAWVDTLSVSIYPINGDGSARTEDYIKALSVNDFQAVERFLKKQWEKHRGLDYEPIEITLQEAVTAQPPVLSNDSNVLKVIFWSLRLRFWAYQNAVDSNKSSINIFVRYHQVDAAKWLAHSLGLQKGLIGVVNAYAAEAYEGKNNVVIAHELLHTVGASDKYDATTGQPIYPEGFVNMDSGYEQSRAEIMAGKIPLSKTESVMPDFLRQCVVGNKTAVEIGWLDGVPDANQ